jgi:hypothetical protein
MTIMLSAFLIVDNLCAITIVVLSAATRSNASLTIASLAASSAEVAYVRHLESIEIIVKVFQ